MVLVVVEVGVSGRVAAELNSQCDAEHEPSNWVARFASRHRHPDNGERQHEHEARRGVGDAG